MSKKKHKTQRATDWSAHELKARASKALAEGRTQQALELAKQLHKQEPTPSHLDFLRKTTLERAKHLRLQGHYRDSANVLDNAVNLGSQDPSWLGQVAKELAAAGNIPRALQILNAVTDPALRTQVLVSSVDEALFLGNAGRNLLPKELQSPFDLIVQAFNQSVAGQDDAARETLQSIGLHSPFLEWKLMIRGLLAYYQKDDLRALENWQRLDSERVPARLVAPLRFTIDPAYRTAQLPETQALLQKQGHKLHGTVMLEQLRAVQLAVVQEDQMPQALRLAESLVPLLRQENPQLVPRLATCLYWAIINNGQPEDVGRFRRVFGEQPEDPQFHRLQALLYEHLGELDRAHQFWQLFEKWLGGRPPGWQPELAKRAQAMIWNHMGRNAATIPDLSKIPNLPKDLRQFPDMPKPLKPSVEECFERSLELVPDQHEGYEELFDYYLKSLQTAPAEMVGRRYLARFPDKAPMLEAVGDLRFNAQDYAEALKFYQEAFEVNPLDRALRPKISRAHLFFARTKAEAGSFDEARIHYQSALEGAVNKSTVWCKWAACEFKAGQPDRAEELLLQALADSGSHLAVAFNMVIEAIRLKLPRKLKNRFDKDFKAALAERPTSAGALGIAGTAASHRLAGITYLGQKTHEKKVQQYLDKAVKVEFNESQLQEICNYLLDLGFLRLLHSYAQIGKVKFPQNPHFYLLDATGYMATGPQTCPVWKVQPLLKEAQRLALLLPPDESKKTLLEEIHKRQEMINSLNPFGMNFLEDIFGRMNEGFEDEEDDDELLW